MSSRTVSVRRYMSNPTRSESYDTDFYPERYTGFLDYGVDYGDVHSNLSLRSLFDKGVTQYTSNLVYNGKGRRLDREIHLHGLLPVLALGQLYSIRYSMASCMHSSLSYFSGIGRIE